MDEKRLFELLENIDKRLQRLETILASDTTSKSDTSKPDKKNTVPRLYSGLTGGIQLLVDDQFFSKPRQLNVIVEELKIKNYHYSKASVSKILARDFVKVKRILNRIKDGNVYGYVIRQ